MDSPVFSIIVCVYNGEKFLKQCLDSLVSQSFRDIEIIIVDDGSTDRSTEICDAYAKKDSRINVIKQKNQGQTTATTHGIIAANGKFFSLVDCDDWIDIDYFEVLLVGISKSPEVMILGFYLEPENKKITTNYRIKDISVTGLTLINSNDVIHSANDACFSWRFLFNRDFVIDNQLLPNKNIIIGEDTEKNLRALRAAKKVICTDYAGYHYRTDNENSLMRRSYSPTLERDLSIQFNVRNSVSKDPSYRYDMARYYVETVLYRVLENAKSSPDGLRYSDIKRIFHYKWLIESYSILGKRLREVVGNRNAYFMNLLIKYRLSLLYFILNKKR